MIPGVRETPATIKAAFPWITQTRALLRPAELQGLVDELQPAVGEFAQFTKAQFQLLPAIDLFNRCQLNVILPTGDARIDDGAFSTGLRNYQEFFQTTVGLAGESQNFDGNGSYTRFMSGGGAYPVQTQNAPAAGLPAVRLRHLPADRNPARARWQAALQAERSLLQAEPAQPERGADRTGPVRRQIRKQLRVFVAIICLLVGALAVTSYLLTQQRFYLPAWVPLIGTDFYVVKVELPTAQAVVPGQGQSVNIAGVKIGEVGDVKLESGRAVVTMQIQDKYKPIYRDANVLMRPKTGLKDMYLALDPGTKQAGAMPENGRVKVANTLPDVNGDEILAQLDTDTRAYLRDPAERGRDRLRRPRDGRRRALPADRRAGPARAAQALRADGALRRPDQQPADLAPPQHQARDPQLPAALDRAGQARRPARRLRGLGQQELRVVRRRGVLAARGAARVPAAR